MIPITRKDHYLNEIVGWGDNAPEKPYIEEEFFFAEILGEAVQAPEPLPRYQMYLAKIAGRNIDIPYPKTRLEYFLAKAAGMDITVPVPITREEIFWSNYSAIVDFEVEGVPPLTYKAIEGTLENYRIYGNTVNGESVGDRTANLWDETIIQGGTNNIGTIIDGYQKRLRSDYIFVEPGETYSFASNLKIRLIYSYDDNNQKVSLIRDAPNGDISYTFTVPNAATKIIITVMKRIDNVEYDITPDDFEWGQLEKGSVVTSYEPYGYRVPVTVEGKNLFDESKTANILKCYLSVSTLVSSVSTRTIFIECKPSTTYTVSKIRGERFVVGWSDKLPAPRVELQEKVINYNASSITITTGLTAKYLVAYIYNAEQDAPITTDEMIASAQIEKGSTATPYEPYHAPVTTPIYLPEPIKMVGDEAEYIDYAEQKQYFADGTSTDVLLPVLPTISGTNTLSVGTEVQPSKVYIKGEKEREYI